MSPKKVSNSSASIAKQKERKSGRGSAPSASAKSPTGGKRHMTGAQSPTPSLSEIKTRLKKPKTFTEIALCMMYLRDAGTVVKYFDFKGDAQFYVDLQAGEFKKAWKAAQKRLEAVVKAGARSVPLSDDSKVRKAYSGALHKWLLTKANNKSTRIVVTKQLAHFLNVRPTVKTPFETEAHADSPFGEALTRPKKAGRMKAKSKRRD